MSGILGHERQLQYFEKVLKNGRLAHAYLFYGPEHVGKFATAKYCASLLGDPQVIILSPENTLVSKKESRKDIPLEDIQELKRIFSLAPEGEKWRIAIINTVEKLSPEASNAFLKLLEEPGTKTLFILISHDKESLLSTIVSRAVGIRFSTVSEGLLLKFAEGPVRDRALCREMVNLAAGRPDLLFRFINEPDFFQKEKRIAQEIKELFQTQSVPLALEISEKVSYNEEERLRVIEHVVRRCREDLNREAIPMLKKINYIAGLIATTNVNPRLALDVILLQALSTKV